MFDSIIVLGEGVLSVSPLEVHTGRYGAVGLTVPLTDRGGVPVCFNTALRGVCGRLVAVTNGTGRGGGVLLGEGQLFIHRTNGEAQHVGVHPNWPRRCWLDRPALERCLDRQVRLELHPTRRHRPPGITTPLPTSGGQVRLP